jgi:hypothetical protein
MSGRTDRTAKTEIAFEKSGTRVEREPDAERLLPRRTFRPPQLLGNLARRRFLPRHRFQITDFSRSPTAPLFCSLSHKASLSTKIACIPYGSERKVNRYDSDHLDIDHVV